MQELCQHQQMLTDARQEIDLGPSDYEEEPEPECDLNQETFPDRPPLPPPSYPTKTQGNNSAILALPSNYRRHSIHGDQMVTIFCFKFIFMMKNNFHSLTL